MKYRYAVPARTQRQSGFTVVELVTTIVVLSILVLAVSARYMDLSNGAERSACISMQLALESAQTLFYTQQLIDGNKGRYAADLAELIPFLAHGTEPVCPGGGTYLLTGDGKISCSDADHAR